MRIFRSNMATSDGRWILFKEEKWQNSKKMLRQEPTLQIFVI